MQPYRSTIEPSVRVEDLGPFEREYRMDPAWRARLLGVSLLALAGAATLLVAFTDSFHPHNRASFSSDREQWAVSIGVALVLAVPGLILLRLWLVERSIRVRLHVRGFTYLRGAGVVEIVPFEHVERLYRSQAATIGLAQFHYRIETRSGARISLSKLQHVGDLGMRIEHELARRKLPELQAGLERGGIASFGAVTMTRDGVTWRGQSRPWSEIDAIRIEGLSFTVSIRDRAAPWFRCAARTLPNLSVLATLAERYARVYR